MAARVNKKSRKREKQMERVKKTLKVGRRRLHLRQLILFFIELVKVLFVTKPSV